MINGQKIFCSLADFADYHLDCAVRTDPDAPKHKGISMIAGAHRCRGL